MVYLRILTVGVCMLLASVSATADQAADEAAIRRAIEENFVTWNAKDVGAHVALYDEVAVPWEHGGKITKEGREKLLTTLFYETEGCKGQDHPGNRHRICHSRCRYPQGPRVENRNGRWRGESDAAK